jgi:hypothetical protein
MKSTFGIPSPLRIGGYSPHSAVDLLIFVASLLLYTLTQTPSVLPADNGEFQLVAWKLGIAHPPGFPLYTLAGFLFSRFFVSPAFALNLLSAILASVTLVLVSRTVRAVTGSMLAGPAAATVLGTSTTFWAQATTANIRMPTALFTAWCVYALILHSQTVREDVQSTSGDVSYKAGGNVEGVGGDSRRRHDDSRRRRRHRLTPFALAFSLGLGHHPSILFPGLFFLVYLILADPALFGQPRRWIRPGIVFLAGLLVFLYLPIRGATGGTLASGEATTYLARPDKLIDHVLARGFEGDFFYFVNARPDLLGHRLSLLPTLLNFQFNAGALILAVLGIWRCLLRDWRWLVMLLGGIVLHVFVTLTYRAPQTVEYMLPAYVLSAILVGCGTVIGSTNDDRRTANIARGPFVVRRWSVVGNALALLALAFGLARGLDKLPSYVWLSQHDDTRAYAESLLRDAPPDAIILSNWHWANPMWYLQQVENQRPDVDVVYVFPRDEPLAISWLKSIDQSLANGRPVVVDMFFREEFAASPYVFEPISREAFLVRQSPISDLPLGFTPLQADFGGQFTLAGYRLLNDSTKPTEPLTLFLAYRVEARPERDYSFSVHLLDPGGRVVGQADKTLPTTRYRSGEMIVERFFVAPLPDTAPGEYALAAGIFSVENGGMVPLSERATVAQAAVEDSGNLATPPERAIALSHGIYLLNELPYSDISTLSPGERITIDLRFLATRPLARDFVVSVQMVGEGFSWKATSDWVPALGAIPTLKWIAGSEIVDRHVIDIPLDAPPGPATVSLILYDNFTRQPLALLDEQLIQQGPSIPLGTWNIAAP